MKTKITKKIGLLYILDKKLLLVHKPSISLYITPGGKVEPNESDIDCLEREIKEELGCYINDPVYYDSFLGKIINNDDLEHICYFGKLFGPIIINPNDTINGYTWIDKYYKQKNIYLGSLLEEKIIPSLIKGGFL